jgi:hypothetical protein
LTGRTKKITNAFIHSRIRSIFLPKWVSFEKKKQRGFDIHRRAMNDDRGRRKRTAKIWGGSWWWYKRRGLTREGTFTERKTMKPGAGLRLSTPLRAVIDGQGQTGRQREGRPGGTASFAWV